MTTQIQVICVEAFVPGTRPDTRELQSRLIFDGEWAARQRIWDLRQMGLVVESWDVMTGEAIG